MLEYKLKEYIAAQKGSVAVVIKGLRSGEEININENLLFPAASTIKLAIMSALLEQAAAGALQLEHRIELTEAMKTGGDGSLQNMESGRRFTLDELLDWMIIVSDNTAANIFIDLLGMENINHTIKSVGLRDTSLQRRMMDFKAAAEGRENIITAKDLAKLLEWIYKGQLISQQDSLKMLEILKRQQVKGRLDLYLPGDVVIAHKAGDLDRVEHDAGIVYLENNEYILCVLTKNVESNEMGRTIIGRISRLVYEAFLEKN